MYTRTIRNRLAVATILAIASVRPLAAQSASTVRPTTSVIGTWRGVSTCLVRPSSCKDEVVVYRVAAGTARDSILLDARKVVNGQEEEMGVLSCVHQADRGAFACAIPRGVWSFQVRGDSLVGELRLTDATKFRAASARRAP